MILDNVFGESVIEVLAGMRRAIAQSLHTELEDVGEDLKTLDSAGQPFFVCLDGTGPSNELLIPLHQEFPHVIFFLLMGDHPAEHLSTEFVEFLYPQLAQGDEERFLEDYEKFRVSLRVR